MQPKHRHIYLQTWIMKNRLLSLIIAGLIILGVVGLWISTIREQDRLLNRGKDNSNRESVPYYSKENGEGKNTNP